MKETIVIITLFLFPMAVGSLLGQADGYQMKGNTQEIDADFLSSYYNQDGNNSAVTGGIGTEELTDVSSMFVLNVPLDTINSISLSLNADFYTSASTDNIDDNVSSASSKDLRTYGTLGYARKNLRKGETYGARIGFSTEYDYTSFSTGLSWAKEFNEGNSELSLNGQAFFDKWSAYFPRELRSTVSLPTLSRKSYNIQAVFSQVINKRMQIALSGEAIYMQGLLSTPFHRVYFQDQTAADIERLPDTRLKIPLSVRVNYFPIDQLVLRTYYRFYWDDFGIMGHTFELETPVKISPSVSLYPFYRYHTQTESDYFAPYMVHRNSEQFYTSDYDLAALSSHKWGMGVKIAPLYGIGRLKFKLRKYSLLQFKSLNIRAAYYKRSTGLTAVLGSVALSFGIK